MIVGVACSDSSDHKAHVDPVDGRKPVAACSNTFTKDDPIARSTRQLEVRKDAVSNAEPGQTRDPYSTFAVSCFFCATTAILLDNLVTSSELDSLRSTMW